MIRLDIREMRTCPACRFFYIATKDGVKEFLKGPWYCMKLVVDGDYTRITDEGIWQGDFPSWCPLPVKEGGP